MNTFGKLREIENSELEMIRSWRNAPEVRSKMYTQHEITSEEHQLWWSSVSVREDQAYFIYENSGVPLGVVSFTQMDKVSANCSWAFYSKPNAPKGSGSRMEYLALSRAFQEYNFHKLSCEVLDFNTAVIRLHKKFGFREEGVFREHHNIDGKYVDIVRLGLLSSEWDAARDELKAALLAH
ncbi:UDP-4-amino-4,6-dideoxy-N-acetyl-beta-L-altrosamine N-acetyltransferase [Sulfitobacter sp. 1A16808]|uniref:UDP-4-amino-4, 6-dideoxy-N-acetyl-beta-L-altrosamine N-acetyltransferase n=1 Tax=Sulfitobacter sp. 1A16808 TaxID=3368572 RepID=UPI003746DAD2